MSGEWENKKLARMLKEEFAVCLDWENEAEVQRAVRALAAYDGVEDFLRATSWGRDNPEIQTERYLTENRVCRWFEGRFWYFSRIRWEDGR